MTEKKVAIVVEWENAVLSEVDRARRMLRSVSSQARAVHQAHHVSIDLIVVYDPAHIDADVPRSVMDQCLDRAGWPGAIELVACEGSSYYSQKNFGAQHTDADYVLFLDSDVIPDDGWMEQLVSAALEGGADVACGETYLSTDNLYERLCAAFWNFDTKKNGSGAYDARNFYANNVIFRRDVIARYPFPSSEAFRGQCVTLARTLTTNGIKISRIRSASVSHPPPASIRHFVHRAICEGHDNIVNRRERGSSAVSASPIGSFLRLVRRVAHAPVRIFRRRKSAGLGLPGAIGAFLMSVAYGGLVFLGEVLAFVSPQFVRASFSI